MWVLAHSICLPAEAAASLPTVSSDIELLVQSRSKVIHEKFCLHGSLTEAYLHSLSGTMLQPLESITKIHEATSSGCEKGVRNSPYAAGSRSYAKTLVQQVKAQDWGASAADSGPKWHGSFAKFDRDTLSWKTVQYSLLGDSELFLETWPRWGSMHAGVSSRHPTPALPIFASESGLWPTPCASDNSDRQVSSNVHITANGLPKHVAANGLKSQMRPSQAVKMWPTPNASDSNKWSNQPLAERLAKRQQVRLNTAVAPEGGKGGQLNPNWVEWLMGWPIGWTDLKPLATARFHEWQQQHGSFYADIDPPQKLDSL